jgi:hypothetical protein
MKENNMKKVLTFAAVALMMAGSTAFACDSCGCAAKKAEKKTECSESCTKGKECTKDAAKKKCTEGEKKECSEKKADA